MFKEFPPSLCFEKLKMLDILFCCIPLTGRGSRGPVHTQGDEVIEGPEYQEVGTIGVPKGCLRQ